MTSEKGLRDVNEIQSQKRRARRRKAVALGACAAVAGIGTIVWFALASPYLRVLHIEVAGNRETESADIIRFLDDGIRVQSRVHALLGPSYLFLWPSAEVAASEVLLPRVARIAVEKSYRAHTVRIMVEERDPFAVWCRVSRAPQGEPLPEHSSSSDGVFAAESDDRRMACAWFDHEGVVLGKAPAVEGNLMYAVHDYSAQDHASPTRVLLDPAMGHLRSVFRVLELADISVREIRFEDPTLEEVRVKTASGPQLYFSLRFPADSAAEVIASLRREKGAGFAKLEYVDFRVENRAFYK